MLIWTCYMLIWTCWGFSVTKYEAYLSCFLVETFLNSEKGWKAKGRELPWLDVHPGEAWVPIHLSIYAGSSWGGARDPPQGNLRAVGKPCAYRAWLDRNSLKLLLGRTIYFVFSNKKAVFNIGQLIPCLLNNERAVDPPRHFGLFHWEVN